MNILLTIWITGFILTLLIIYAIGKSGELDDENINSNIFKFIANLITIFFIWPVVFILTLIFVAKGKEKFDKYFKDIMEG